MSDDRLRALSREERVALCHEVMAKLSDLVDGEAPHEFCERVDEMFADCQPFQAYRDTLAATIRLTQECGSSEPSAPDMDALRRCVDKVRSRLLDDESEVPPDQVGG